MNRLLYKVKKYIEGRRIWRAKMSEPLVARIADTEKPDLWHMSDDEIDEAFREAVRQSIEEAKKKGLPYCGFDMERMQSYIQYPDGRREYADM